MSSKKFIATISLDLELRDQLEELAKEQNRTRSGMIQNIIIEFFQRKKTEGKLWENPGQ